MTFLEMGLFTPEFYANHNFPFVLEIIEGQGPEANEGNLVEINYVCRRSNGYFVHR